MPSEYYDRLRRWIEQAYRTELRAMPGMLKTLGALRIPACVASSSYPARLRLGWMRQGCTGAWHST